MDEANDGSKPSKPAPQIRILTRPPPKSAESSQSEEQKPDAPKPLTFQEREEEYVKARERIFTSDDKSSTPSVQSPTTPTDPIVPLPNSRATRRGELTPDEVHEYTRSSVYINPFTRGPQMSAMSNRLIPPAAGAPQGGVRLNPYNNYHSPTSPLQQEGMWNNPMVQPPLPNQPFLPPGPRGYVPPKDKPSSPPSPLPPGSPLQHGFLNRMGMDAMRGMNIGNNAFPNNNNSGGMMHNHNHNANLNYGLMPMSNHPNHNHMHTHQHNFMNPPAKQHIHNQLPNSNLHNHAAGHHTPAPHIHNQNHKQHQNLPGNNTMMMHMNMQNYPPNSTPQPYYNQNAYGFNPPAPYNPPQHGSGLNANSPSGGNFDMNENTEVLNGLVPQGHGGC